ncbi:MAG: tetratricopeptide repeat protein [Richelia sp. RM2_1_2]|nr:tetratricopeptide repeat protein [Richelia sp. RM2_1_2]
MKFLQQSLPLIQEAGIRYFEPSILNSLGDTYFKQEKYDKAIEHYQKALPIAREVKDKSLEFQILVSLGDSYTKQEKYDKTLEFYQQALPLVNKNTEQEAAILVLIGNCYFQQGKHDLAIENLQKSLIITRERKNPTIEAQTLAGIAVNYHAQKKHDKAIEFYQQALALYGETANNRSTKLTILMQIMRIYYVNASDATLQKDYYRGMIQANEALKLVPDALKLARELKNSEVEKNILGIQSQSYSLIGNYHLKLRELEKAEKFIQQGLNIALQYKILDAERFALSLLPELYKDQGDIRKVIELSQRELEIAQQLGDPAFEAQALLRLAMTYSVLGDFDKSIQLSQQALSKANEIDIHKLPNYSQSHAYYQKLSALGFLSLVYTNIGEYDKAFEYAQQRLTFAKTLKNPEFEANALIALGDVYQNKQEFQKAIEITQQALTIARDIKNSDLEAEAFKKLSASHTGKGDYQQALDSAQQVLIIAEKTKNLKLKRDALNIQRQIYTKQGNYKKTLELFQEALSIAKQNIDPDSELSSLQEIGLFYKTLGDEQKSNEYLQQSLALAQKIKNPQSEAISFFLIAYSYFGKNQPEKIIEYANRGLAILPKTKTIEIEIIGNIVLSLGYGELKNEQKAMEAAQASLELARKSKNPNDEKEVLTFIGGLQRRFGKQQEAIQTYNQALAIKTQAKAVGADSGIYAGLGRTFADLNQPNVAITHYKEAINRIEEVRSGIKLLTPDLQASFLESIVDFDKGKIADTYRELAELLITQGRQAEARQVLDLLKIQEIRDFASAKTDTTAKPEILLTETEKKIQTESQSIIALSTRISECEKTNCKQKSQLYDQRTALLTQFNQDLEKIEKEIRDRIVKDPNTFRPDSPKAIEIVKAQPGTVMVYPLVMEDKLWLLLYSGDAAKKFEVQVSRDELGNTVKQFRKLMEECETRSCGAEDIAKIKPVSQKLYNWLIKPLEVELKQNKVKNLVFALDRVTRYVPMSALYDGKQYLIENYTTYNVLSADLTDTNARLPMKSQDTKVLAMGVSDAVGNFPPLNDVRREINNIVRSSNKDKGIYPGKEYLNKDFDYKTLRDNITGNNILHLATHGEFVPGIDKASYLLLGDNTKLAIPDIQTLGGLSNIHLVVLSACQTALAGERQDGVEIATLAYSFINKGAKSVIASLWQVADNSTSTLMQNFYNNLANSKQPITKAEAMRLAQLQLLYDKNVTISDIKRAGGLIPEGLQSSGKKSELETFAHPYYWSPFVLIGNGL